MTSVDPEASKVGLQVLKHGGNAVDAAVATAAALGVTEPYSSGLGGGGYFVYYDAKQRKVRTIDGRETAPKAMPNDAFIDPKTGSPTRSRPTSSPAASPSACPAPRPPGRAPCDQLGQLHREAGACAGRRPGRPRLRRRQDVPASRPQENKTRFQAFTTTPKLFLPGGAARGSARCSRTTTSPRPTGCSAAKGSRPSTGVRSPTRSRRCRRRPPKSPDTKLPVPKGFMHASDLAAYRAIARQPTHVGYRGYDVYGMAPSSSGGSTVGEIAEHHGAVPARPREDRLGAAPLPRGDRLWRSPTVLPTSVTRLRRRTPARPALRPLRRGACLQDQRDEGVHAAGRRGRRRRLRRQVRQRPPGNRHEGR